MAADNWWHWVRVGSKWISRVRAAGMISSTPDNGAACKAANKASVSSRVPSSTKKLDRLQGKNRTLHPYYCCQAAFGISVINMWPGAWLTANGTRDAITAACGVTPQAQNTGISPGRSVTGSPKSGLLMS